MKYHNTKNLTLGYEVDGTIVFDKINDYQKRMVIQDYKNGKTLVELAAEWVVSIYFIEKILK